ncbi:MAG: LLM class flavin-dependent oxidoreductase, partial [Mycobacterium sp.]|nr:LLM class flavin-dependent oxidoreductase [Mycobacterium sp.]
CEPRPLQSPHPPIVVGGSRPKMLRVIARHADEWNMPGHEGPQRWARTNLHLDEACAEVGRDPARIQRSVQLFLHPGDPEQLEGQLGLLPRYRDAGCQHVVLSFHEPPDRAVLQRCAAL